MCKRSDRLTDHKSLLVVTPTSSEYAFVHAAVRDWMGDDGQVYACGMGPASATALCQRLEASASALKGLALIGWAGGLRPNLSPGDVVLADAALGEQGARVPCTVVPLPGATVGTLLTVPRPLLTPRAKRAAGQSGALAVEMEAYPLAAWAWAHKVPFVHARVILDAASESLPDLAEAFDLYGRVHAGRLVRRLRPRPWLAVGLVRLVRRTRALGPVLGQVARVVVQAWS